MLVKCMSKAQGGGEGGAWGRIVATLLYLVVLRLC